MVTSLTSWEAQRAFEEGTNIPDEVIHAINSLIKKYWNGNQAVVPTWEINFLVGKETGDIVFYEFDEWDGIKPLFESTGWDVSLYKDCHLGNYEHIPQRFVFTKPTEGGNVRP